jgi:hypothetical protein
MMQHSQNKQDSHCADQESVPSELRLEERWDSGAVRDLIRSKSGFGETPAFLFLGRIETAMLRTHLAEAFGEESVTTLKGTHYMGLKVVEIQCDSFLATAGRKTSRTTQNPAASRPAWKDRDDEALWQLRLDR